MGGIAEHRRSGSPPPLAPPHRVEAAHDGERDPPREAPRITLIESNTRKCAFLREVVRQTGIAGCVTVDILSTRIEAAAT